MLLALFTFPPTFELEDEGDRDIGRGVDVNDGTDGFENVGMVVVAVENRAADETAVLSGDTVSLAVNLEIEAR